MLQGGAHLPANGLQGPCCVSDMKSWVHPSRGVGRPRGSGGVLCATEFHEA